MASRDCLCNSGLPYASCCGPLHRGEREATDATALMRSRYAAFATKEIDYLWRTLHADHDDRAHPKDTVLRALREACTANRYMGLTILDASAPSTDGIARVLFAARVFHRGKDLSFLELSDFLHDGTGWRYLRGDNIPLTPDALSLTIDTFTARYA